MEKGFCLRWRIAIEQSSEERKDSVIETLKNFSEWEENMDVEVNKIHKINREKNEKLRPVLRNTL